MPDEASPSLILDSHGRPARQAIETTTCPGCRRACPPGDETTRVRSGGFGAVHDCCGACGYDFEELTV